MTDPRLKRLHIRSWRRGIREMDLILGGFANTGLSALDDADLTLYEAMLEENDHDLYAWVSGQAEPPARYRALLATISAQLA